ncbi:sigma factor-like helix-turn-helix DNA-binding protein [Variovorax rhizosphaerae]|uniref:Sigma factor-like helix-turn-helix DNA-binding protein n=1 Tax=Variovorax rhizosphaerae TaxID=1836200 RepID=A0ABU8WJH3_9BURK
MGLRKDRAPPSEVLHPTEALSLGQVAAALGVSKQRVQQIESRALRKLTTELARRGLSLEDLLAERGDMPGITGRRFHRSD